MKYLSLFLFSLFIISGCFQKSENEIILSKVNEKPNPFIGEWESFERMYPYGAVIQINSDSTFNFKEGACVYRGFSKGKWTMKNDTLILNSSKLDSCLYISYFDADCYIISADDTAIIKRETTICGCIPTYENEYIVFKNDQFYIYNDTLMHKPKSKRQCKDIRNIFFKIEKDTISNH